MYNTKFIEEQVGTDIKNNIHYYSYSHRFLFIGQIFNENQSDKNACWIDP